MALHIVKADGSGDFTTHALAIAAAGAGDTIETQDSATYNEQFTIAAALLGLTMQAAAGGTDVRVKAILHFN